MLADAVRLLRERGQDVVLRVVGSVPAAGAPAARAMYAELGDALETTGYVTQEQLAVEYRSAHVLAFPSLFEGFGIPVLEAMTAALPVVVSDRTSLPEVAGGAGIVAPAEDAEAWAAALADALTPATRAALVSAGNDREGAFDWQTSAVGVSRILADSAVV
jgi:glycosyltransferase involved in cell wall biosynthesis